MNSFIFWRLWWLYFTKVIFSESIFFKPKSALFKLYHNTSYESSWAIIAHWPYFQMITTTHSIFIINFCSKESKNTRTHHWSLCTFFFFFQNFEIMNFQISSDSYEKRIFSNTRELNLNRVIFKDINIDFCNIWIWSR